MPRVPGGLGVRRGRKSAGRVQPWQLRRREPKRRLRQLRRKRAVAWQRHLTHAAQDEDATPRHAEGAAATARDECAALRDKLAAEQRAHRKLREQQEVQAQINLREMLENQKLLGKGATSKVYLAKHRFTGELFAVKELSAMADEDTRSMAVNEIKIANRHAAHAEHLVKTVDAYFHNDKICIAMQFADAGHFPPPLALIEERTLLRG